MAAVPAETLPASPGEAAVAAPGRDDDTIRLALSRVLASPTFAAARTHHRLLAHLVDCTLAGETHRLKETLLGIEVFRRPAASFDPSTDSIVRVEGRRLRQRLARYYAAEGAQDAWRIELPKGGYLPRLGLGAAGAAASPEPAPPQTLALELLERGEFFLREGHEAGHRKALARFTEAVAAEPTLATAHWGQARAWNALVSTNREPPQTGVVHAEAAVRRALALAPQHPQALALLAQILHRYHYRWAAADALFQQAERAAPGNAYVRHAHAFSLMMRRDFGRAEAELRLAHAVDPLNLSLRAHEALLQLYRGDHPRCEASLHALLDMSPGNVLAQSLLAYLQLQRGAFEAALASYREVAAQHPGLSIGEAGCAQALARLGRRAEARAVLGALQQRHAGGYLSPYQCALVQACLGERSEALAWLARAVDERDPNAMCLPVDPGWDALRSEPRFAALERRVLG